MNKTLTKNSEQFDLKFKRLDHVLQTHREAINSLGKTNKNKTIFWDEGKVFLKYDSNGELNLISDYAEYSLPFKKVKSQDGGRIYLFKNGDTLRYCSKNKNWALNLLNDLLNEKDFCGVFTFSNNSKKLLEDSELTPNSVNLTFEFGYPKSIECAEIEELSLPSIKPDFLQNDGFFDYLRNYSIVAALKIIEAKKNIYGTYKKPNEVINDTDANEERFNLLAPEGRHQKIINSKTTNHGLQLN